MSRFLYPDARRDESIVENHFGVSIRDPYRWLEDPSSEETKNFINEQNKITYSYIHECKEALNIKSSLKKLMNYPKVGVPQRHGNKYFFKKNTGLQNQSVMYVQDSLDSTEPRVFLDPNALSPDGSLSLSTYDFSENGQIFAYGLSACGSDVFNIHFKDVETERKYPEILKKVKYSSLAWTHDHAGIFYQCSLRGHSESESSQRTDQLEHQALYYHRLGTPQSSDVIVVQFLDHPKWIIVPTLSHCGKYLILSVIEGCKDNLIFISDLTLEQNKSLNQLLELKQLVHQFEFDYEYVTNVNSLFYFRSNQKAPKYAIYSTEINAESIEWTPSIPESEKDVLDWAKCVHRNKLLLCYISDVKHSLQIADLTSGKVLTILPMDIGTIVGVSGKPNQSEFFYHFSSMIHPGLIYRVDLETRPFIPTLYYETKIEGFNSSDYSVKQIFYSSEDGTLIPMFISSKKNRYKDGKTPTILHGYGGFNVTRSPSFSVFELFFIRHFGNLAIANIRGGGEYGDKWHNEGRLLNKQNSFTDFICGAEYLIKEKYTVVEKLIIKGESNGGLLVSACLNQRPDLFGAVLPDVGVMDLLRFHKFTIGYTWTSDFGSPEVEIHCKNLLQFSPLHNVTLPKTAVTYPAVLLTTADHDDRVVPSHSLKFIATLQYTLGKWEKQVNPLMIRMSTKAGHGSGKPTSQLIEEFTDVYCFLVQSLGLQFE